jgi:hypothetical protein
MTRAHGIAFKRRIAARFLVSIPKRRCGKRQISTPTGWSGIWKLSTWT